MAQTLRGACGRIVNAAENRGHHIAMLERRSEACALLGIVTQPVKQFGEAPFGGVNAAAPIDGFETLSAGRRRDFGGLLPGAMVAPQVVVVDRLQVRVDGDDARSGGVERDGFDSVPVDRRAADGVVHRLGQRRHVVGVTLGGVVGIVLLAQKRICAGPRAQTAFGAIEDGYADAQRPEVDTGNDTHNGLLCRGRKERITATDEH